MSAMRDQSSGNHARRSMHCRDGAGSTMPCEQRLWHTAGAGLPGYSSLGDGRHLPVDDAALACAQRIMRRSQALLARAGLALGDAVLVDLHPRHAMMRPRHRRRDEAVAERALACGHMPCTHTHSHLPPTGLCQTRRPCPTCAPIQTAVVDNTL